MPARWSMCWRRTSVKAGILPATSCSAKHLGLQPGDYLGLPRLGDLPRRQALFRLLPPERLLSLQEVPACPFLGDLKLPVPVARVEEDGADLPVGELADCFQRPGRE